MVYYHLGIWGTLKTKMKKIKQWTIQDIKTVLKLWKSKTSKEICDELGVREPQLYYIAKEIRKKNPKILPKKHKTGYLQNLIEEALKAK